MWRKCAQMTFTSGNTYDKMYYDTFKNHSLPVVWFAYNNRLPYRFRLVLVLHTQQYLAGLG